MYHTTTDKMIDATRQLLRQGRKAQTLTPEAVHSARAAVKAAAKSRIQTRAVGRYPTFSDYLLAVSIHAQARATRQHSAPARA